jgi:hypothetical protein
MAKQNYQDRRYRFSFQDKKENELFFRFYWCPNLQYANKLAKVVKAHSLINDLYRIRVTCAY